MTEKTIKKKKIACVTGASGTVGQRIVEQSIMEGYSVRALVRKKWFALKNVDVFYGGLEDEEVLSQFVADADYLYHCAAEIRDESKMWEVNVEGTRRLIEIVRKSTIKTFLYLSSAGVVGTTQIKDVKENTPCNPTTIYEKTKWEAEKLVAKGIDNCSVVILRPTNIIDYKQSGVLHVAMNKSVINRLTQLIRGGECAHVVHAKDVANAAIFFNQVKLGSPECFFVSCDGDKLNTFSGLRKIYNSVLKNKPLESMKSGRSLPLFIPYFLRKIRLRQTNWGDVKYSSSKLLNSGFRFSYDTGSAVSEIFSLRLGFTTKPKKENISLYPKKKIDTLVVIGESGFIGRNLIKRISQKNYIKLRVLVQRDEHIQLFQGIPNATVIKGTLLRKETLENLLLPGCTVVNLAYMENETQATNVLAIKNLSDVCRSKKIKRLVHCSTAAVVGNVRSKKIDENTQCNAKADYEITKLKVEEHLIISAHGHYELAILRPTSVFGPGGKNLIKLADELTHKANFLNYLRSCFSGKRSMNLVCLDNVISSIFFLCESYLDLDQNLFIISDDNNPFNNYRDIEDILIQKLSLSRYPIPRIPFPGFLLTQLLWLLKKPITQTKRIFIWDRLLDAGYKKATTMDEELTRFCEWYQSEARYFTK